MDNEIQEIVKIINELSGKFSGYEVFSDWVKVMALSIANFPNYRKDSIWKKREEEYIAIANKHGTETMLQFSEMYMLLGEALGKEMEDVLGRIYMEAGLGSKQTGQFFTPFHISKMVASMTIPENISPTNPYILHEPSCGGGGMIIAFAKAIAEQGINYCKCLKVVAQDLDWKGVYMTFVQLSLLGIDAVVVQGDTLAEPFKPGYPPERVLETPVRKGLKW